MSASEWLNPFDLYNPNKPAGRLKYFWGNYVYPILFLSVIALCGGFAEAMLGYYDSSPIVDLLTVPLGIGYVLATVLIIIRRLKDLGRSGWLVLLGLVPLVNFVLGLWLLFAPGVSTSDQSPASGSAAQRESDTSAPPPDPGAGRRFCSYCGNQLQEGAEYCSACGRKVI